MNWYVVSRGISRVLAFPLCSNLNIKKIHQNYNKHGKQLGESWRRQANDYGTDNVI